MEILMNNEVVKLTDECELIEQVERLIESYLVKNMIFHKIVIDGTEYYNDYEEPLRKALAQKKTISITMQSIQEHVEETLFATQEYLERATPLLEKLGNDFYLEEEQNRWNKLNDLIEGIAWVNYVLALLGSGSVRLSLVIAENLKVENLNSKTQELYSAMEMKDNVLIADLIIYEILPLFTELEQVCNKVLKEGIQ